MSFLDDLETAYAHARTLASEVPDVSAAELDTLGDQLEDWRESQLHRLEEYLEKLPVDDPLRSPVSLFGTMDFGRLETAHTRTLAWLLGEGEREHGFEFQLLEALLHHLLPGREFCLSSEIVVESEKSIDYGRIDLFAEGLWKEEGKDVSWRLIIEAKIDAKESEDQLTFYDEWVLQHGNTGSHIVRVFLTPTGRKPTSTTADWQSMKFVELARVFRCVPGLQDKPGFHFLRYYLAGVLRDICGFTVPISRDCKNPHAAIEYLQAVINPHK